jgi:hypothetical protein
MSRLDPAFSGKAPETMRFHSRGDLPLPARDEAVLARAREQVQEQVSQTPTPVTAKLKKKLPSEAEFFEKVKEVARTYGVPEATVRGYIEKDVFPGGRSGHQLWEGGYGINAVSALRRFEQQANFSSQTGMTPNEAIESAYTGNKSMKSRESEVASALGIPNYEADQKRREYLASAPERRNNIFKVITDPHQRMIALQKFDEELKRMREEERRGGKKSRKAKKSKKARKTRRRA